MLNLREFISGQTGRAPVDDSAFGVRLENIRPTNLNKPFSWLKVLIKGAFQHTMTNTSALSISVGKPLGQLGYNAQYPYLQKALRIKLNNDNILVYDGTALTPLIVNPTSEQDTLVIDGGVVVHPANEHRLAAFVIQCNWTLTIEQKERIKAETDRLKLAGVRYIIVSQERV